MGGTSRADLERALARFGHLEFRAGQREAIETLLESGRLLLVAPTGGGKSLTYQLPASLLPGTTLVVSPLIALMQDQVRALDAIGVPATFLAATVGAAESSRRIARIAGGELKLVYVAPERLVLSGFRRVLRDLEVPLVAIDEAHCISEWGHDFRPEYLEIDSLLAELRPAHVLACTATATPLVRDEILVRLGLPPETPQLLRGFARPNLVLRASEVSGSRERRAAVDAQLAEALGSPASEAGSAIVYAPTRRASESEAERLQAAGWRAESYHAGLDGVRRERVASDFLEGRLQVVAATNAFGMGIDRADVRAVVHLSPPASLEAYYQEVGRAGRDGDRAYGLLLLSPDDLPRRRRLIELGGDNGPTPPAVVEHKWGLFLELLRWAEGGSCRHDAILRYFGDEDETLAGCGQCDVCARLDEPDEHSEEERTLIVRKALSAVARVHGRFGLKAAVNLLRGVADDRLVRSGLDSSQTFGVLKEHGDVWLLRLLQRCVTAGWVAFTADERPLTLLTDAGRQVMLARRPARLLLPPAYVGVAASRSARRRAPAEPLPPGDDALFQALRAWRQETARRDRVPAYVVAQDRTLRDIAGLRPKSKVELEIAWGMGPQRIERHGDAILGVVSALADA
jgi:ATP-dependent DNA helicase RecQ